MAQHELVHPSIPREVLPAGDLLRARLIALRRFTVGACPTAAYQTYTPNASPAASSRRIRRMGATRRILCRGVGCRGMARRDIDRLQEEIEELFADLWQVPRFAGTRHGFRPAVDCFQTDDPRELTIVVELPGVDPATVRIAVEDRSLTIAGARPRPRRRGPGLPAGRDRVRTVPANDPAHRRRRRRTRRRRLRTWAADDQAADRRTPCAAAADRDRGSDERMSESDAAEPGTDARRSREYRDAELPSASRCCR